MAAGGKNTWAVYKTLQRPHRERLTSSWSGRSSDIAGAPQVRHFIMHMRRAGQRSMPPLNCSVIRKAEYSVLRHGARRTKGAVSFATESEHVVPTVSSRPSRAFCQSSGSARSSEVVSAAAEWALAKRFVSRRAAVSQLEAQVALSGPGHKTQRGLAAHRAVGVLSSHGGSRITSSWSGPSCVIASAQQARHFILHLLRAAGRGVRPLNCGVDMTFVVNEVTVFF